jgi:hypothetical protein
VAKKKINNVVPEPEPVVVVEPVADVAPEPVEELEAGEIIRDGREYLIRVDGATYHHVRDARDGRWIYAHLKPGG